MLDKRYDHNQTEQEIYQLWLDLGVFSPERQIALLEKHGIKPKNKTFSVLMPPPNANAPLHMGHATYTIQDLMTRYKRMQGFKTVYVPGTDHAGFETQVVYERLLKKQQKSRFDFDRKTLFEDILAFVKENSGVAIQQLKRLGMSADWSRLTFMLDKQVIKTVYDTFKKLHEDGLVYRDFYLVNYSPHHGTTFSNLETEHIEKTTCLYFVNYKVKNSEEVITVATVRPETIFADTAIAVNPQDKRYKKLVDKTVINPLTGKEMPVIADDAVDMEFGTGALKITPGHDFTDYEIGKKHNLEIISIINLEGKLQGTGTEVDGLRVKQAREKTVEILKEKGALARINENYVHNLLVDYKDKLPIEPMLLPNWFVRVDGMAQQTIRAVEENKVKFNKPVWKKEMLRWLKDIRDWPISRQIVFGIRIPVWYNVEETKNVFVTFLDNQGNSHELLLENALTEGFTIEEIREGLQKLIAPTNAKYVIAEELPGDSYLPETDTFDTWFSSGQWPLTTLKYPDGEDFKEFFPTSFMDTMWDILFFWIARMLMFSLYLTEQVPFRQVYIHGMVTDEHGQKMSKSKGNVINPMDFIEKYGADALRMGILVGGNTAAREFSLSEDKVRGYRNFANKIWNMARFILGMVEQSDKSIPNFNEAVREKCTAEDTKILEELAILITDVNNSFKRLRFTDAGNAIYHFMWHRLADEYIEHVKNREDKDVALSVLTYCYNTCLKLLHPFMPFVTEKIWENMPKEKSIPLIIAPWPK